MLHPLIHLLATRPQLLGDHAQAYGELISAEVATQAQTLKRRTIWFALTICLVGVAMVLAGVAALLWAALLPALQPVPWTLTLVPLVPAVMAVVCGLMAQRARGVDDGVFAELRRQVLADMALLRTMGTA